MTLNREEFQQLDELLQKVCEGQNTCKHCPTGYYEKRSGAMYCLMDRILKQVEAEIRLKEKETNDR